MKTKHRSPDGTLFQSASSAKNEARERRYLCLFLPPWPIQCIRRKRPETMGKPLALFERTAHGAVLILCSDEASRLDIRSGMPVADARALAPEMLVEEIDWDACAAQLEELCLWSIRFSPLVGLEPVRPVAGGIWDGGGTLFLDTTGCECVFGGEENLLRLALEGIRKSGFEIRAAYAPTLGAAWALAHCGAGIFPAQAGSLHHNFTLNGPALASALAELPLEALRLETEPLGILHALGLQTIADLMRQPRATLPSRIGEAPLRRLDQALGTVPERLTLLRPAPEFRVAWAFEYPVRNSELLFPILERVMRKLAADLLAAGRAAREMECWLFHELAAPVRVECLLHRSSAIAEHLWQLLRTRLEDVLRTPRARRSPTPSPLTPLLQGERGTRARKTFLMEVDERVLEVEEGVCAVVLQVLSSESLRELQLKLFEREAEEPASRLGLLWDRLASRLGHDAVLRAGVVEHTLPENTVRFEQVSHVKSTVSAPVPPEVEERPLRIYSSPTRILAEWPKTFLWNGQTTRIASFSGPERIETAWWEKRDQRRDYYVVETESGARYWIFQRLDDGGWFMHGVFE